MSMEVNGDYGEVEVAEFTEVPYAVQVGVRVLREYEEDGGGAFRQVTLATESSDDTDDFELLLSVSEAERLRDLLTHAIRLATQAPEPTS